MGHCNCWSTIDDKELQVSMMNAEIKPEELVAKEVNQTKRFPKEIYDPHGIPNETPYERYETPAIPGNAIALNN